MRTKAPALIAATLLVAGCTAVGSRYCLEPCCDEKAADGKFSDGAATIDIAASPADELVVLEANNDAPARRGEAPRPTQGSLRARNQKGEELGELPLRHTDVQGEVTGFLSATKVTQTFENHSKEPIEAVYVFPLPETAAVN